MNSLFGASRACCYLFVSAHGSTIVFAGTLGRCVVICSSRPNAYAPDTPNNRLGTTQVAHGIFAKVLSGVAATCAQHSLSGAKFHLATLLDELALLSFCRFGPEKVLIIAFDPLLPSRSTKIGNSRHILRLPCIGGKRQRAA